MLCLLNKSSLIKNFDLSSVLPVDPVTYIMTNITFFWLKSAFIARHETRNFKLPWGIFGDYVNAEAWVICFRQERMCILSCFRWMSWYSAERTSKSVTLDMPISCPACRACQTQKASRSACPTFQTGRAKTGNESSARRGIWDLSLARSVLGCEGMNPIFHAYGMLILSTNGPFNFVMPKYIKLRLSH